MLKVARKKVFCVKVIQYEVDVPLDLESKNDLVVDITEAKDKHKASVKTE